MRCLRPRLPAPSFCTGQNIGQVPAPLPHRTRPSLRADSAARLAIDTFTPAPDQLDPPNRLGQLLVSGGGHLRAGDGWPARRIAIFGATLGRCGGEAMWQLLREGHKVTVLARRMPAYSFEHPHLTVVQGDVCDPEAVYRTVRGSDGVLIALGVSAGGAPSQLDVCSVGTANILLAMGRAAVKPVACISAYGVGSTRDMASPWVRLANWGNRAMLADKEVQEQLVRDSDRDWTILQPRQLTTRNVDAVYHVSPAGYSMSAQVARRNVADFACRQLLMPTQDRQSVVLSDTRLSP